ncbi:methyltransferase domain-containing protein [Haloplanus sp. C73]|uniref:methyltransferase domain-containing protein n=1 Tax=Haloplanus sp. C73 TaxID=3421641 RepID=UPI003EBEBAA0
MANLHQRARQGQVLELGAGESPYPQADTTMDIREDVDGIDVGGVDVGRDRIPVDDESFDVVVMFQVLEHIPPDRVGFLFRECDRVLRAGGLLHIELPHAGTISAQTDLTHRGTGGTTPAVRRYFDGGSQQYWPDLEWDVETWAELSAPTIVAGSRRISFTVSNAALSHALTQVPFVTGAVTIQALKRQ